MLDYLVLCQPQCLLFESVALLLSSLVEDKFEQRYYLFITNSVWIPAGFVKVDFVLVPSVIHLPLHLVPCPVDCPTSAFCTGNGAPCSCSELYLCSQNIRIWCSAYGVGNSKGFPVLSGIRLLSVPVNHNCRFICLYISIYMCVCHFLI